MIQCDKFFYAKEQMKNYVVLFYGLAVAISGLFGYWKGSNVSLFMGMGFGSLLMLSSIAMFARKKWGIYMALTLNIALTLVFTLRYFKTHSSTPATLALISACVLCYLVITKAAGRSGR